jgi:hypothetical protein
MATPPNKSTRDEIIDNIVQATDVPHLLADLTARTKARARTYIADYLPEGFQAAVAGHPKEWFSSNTSCYVGGDGNPLSVLSTVTGQGYRHDGYIYLDDPILVPHNTRLEHPPAEEFFADLVAEATALVDRITTMKIEARAFLNSCKTVEQLIERMPELEPHIPKVSKPMPLVAPSNLLSTLSGFGFDRTQKSA